MLEKFQQILKNKDAQIIDVRCYYIGPCLQSHMKSENRFRENLLGSDIYTSSRIKMIPNHLQMVIPWSKSWAVKLMGVVSRILAHKDAQVLFLELVNNKWLKGIFRHD